MVALAVSQSLATLEWLSGGHFSPATLFATSEPGVWFDPSDVANTNWRTNLFTYTDQFVIQGTTDWVARSVTTSIQPNNTVLVTETTATDLHTFANNSGSGVNFVTGQAYTISVEAKINSGTRNVRFSSGNSGIINFATVFNLINGTVVSGAGATITALEDGWYRLTATRTALTSGNTGVTSCGLANGTSGSYAGDGTSSILFRKPQFEVGSIATEYQPITTVAAGTIASFPQATLYQDRTGTLPVTAPAQPVGLMLSKDQGLALGSELQPNGDFSSGTTGWTFGTAWSIVSGRAFLNYIGIGPNLTGSVTTVVGKVYLLTFDYEYISGTNTVRIGNTTYIIPSVSGTYTARISAATTASIIFGTNTGTAQYYIDNISVREVLGNHAAQSTAGSRPTYGIVPATGRRNLLLATDTLATQSLTVTAVSHILSFTGTGTITLSGVSTAGPLVGTGVSNRVSLTFTPTAGSLTLTVSGSVTLAQLELGSTATAYQKVVTAFEVTEANVASLSYLSFDGVDDFMITPTITPATDKVQVFAGVRKLSDAARGTVFESSTTIASNNGALHLTAPNAASATYAFESKGTALTDAVATATAPVTSVLTGLGDIAGDSVILRVNGTQADQDTGDQGTGNYLAYPFYLGRRAGTSLPFNGQMYGIITRFGANLDTSQLVSTEGWLNTRTGAY